ncbi:MAG: hemerythrin domain-containing protein [Solirubrobacterales bacterium]|nr:hemerythrin domain-containing protein [Solirubrobacterales bacterium]
MADMITKGETMNRLIHRAVRRDLARFTDALQRFTPGDRARATALADAFSRFDTMLTHHHEGEERNLWPVIGDPGAGHVDDVAGLTTEHESIVAGLATSRDAFGRLGTSASAADAGAATAGLAQLREAAETHFAHEESEMRELCEAADPAAVGAAFKKMGRDASPAEGMWFMQWVGEGLSGQDAAAFNATIPAPVRMISKVVAGRRYAKVQRAAWS